MTPAASRPETIAPPIVDKLSTPVHADDHVNGRSDAPVTLIEYGDFECLHCARAFPIIQQLRSEMPETVRLVFRHFPLGWEHPHATVAARASEAAARQGKFWEMHEQLYTNQGFLDEQALHVHAEMIGLDAEQFSRDLADPSIAARVERDVANARASGVHGTPTFFLNGRRYGDSWDFDAFRKAILVAAKAGPNS